MAKQAPGAPSTPPRGTAKSGRIVSLLFGPAHGFIRVASHGKVFFHRSDVREGTKFSDLEVGDLVHFELLEDAVSGPRAVRVERRRRTTR